MRLQSSGRILMAGRLGRRPEELGMVMLGKVNRQVPRWAGTSRRHGLRVALAILTGVSLFLAVTPGARASSSPSGLVINSSKGFLGCLYNGNAASPDTYCFVAQVPSTGPQAGKLTLTSWICTSPGREDTTSSAVLSRRDLRVSQDGSFSFVDDNVPGMGEVLVHGVGQDVHEPAVAQGDDVMFFWPQAFRLASPTLGLTLYEPISGSYGLPLPYVTSASVGGVPQPYFAGVVWSAPTSGQWDALECF